MSTFKIVVIGIFIFFAVIGVFLFATYGGSNKAVIPTVTIWGTLPAANVTDYIHQLNGGSTIINAIYSEIDPASFKQTFVNAIAEGKGPDLVILPDDLLYQERNKVVPIGYQTYPERDFRDTYVDEASIFLSPDGVLGVPFAIDPLVMYWNKDLFSTAGIARPPQYWNELTAMGPELIQRNDTSNITQAMVPFGEFRNVTNAKEILASLFFQAGSDITTVGDTGDYYSTLDVSPGSTATSPANAAVTFYSGFSNPVNPLYTWNRSLPNSIDAFLAGNLAMYFGFASELRPIQSKNPNLNFDVATLPQAENTTKSSYGRIYALSIVKGGNAANLTQDLAAISIMTSATAMQSWTDISLLPPVRRDLLTTRPKDPYLDVFYSAAVQSKTWMDPDPDTSDSIFQDMIESVTTGAAGSGTDVVTLAKQRLDQALKDNK